MKDKVVSNYKWLQRVVIWIKVEFKSSFIILAYIVAGVLISLAISIVIVFIFPKVFSSLVGTSGSVLQIGGFITVGRMIIERRHLFTLPSFREKMKRFPKRRQSTTIIAGGATATIHAFGDINVEGYATVTPQPGASVEERLSALEANIARQTKRIDDMKRDFKQETFSIRKQLSDLIIIERSEHESDINEIKLKIRGLAVGGIKWETVGLFWLIIGFIMAILSDKAF